MARLVYKMPDLSNIPIKPISLTAMGFAIGTLLVCELPVILVAIGLSGVVAKAGGQLSQTFELVAITMGGLGLLGLIAVYTKRLLRNLKRGRS